MMASLDALSSLKSIFAPLGFNYKLVNYIKLLAELILALRASVYKAIIYISWVFQCVSWIYVTPRSFLMFFSWNFLLFYERMIYCKFTFYKIYMLKKISCITKYLQIQKQFQNLDEKKNLKATINQLLSK